MIQHYQLEWVEEWCLANGWTDLFQERIDHYWAFPPGAVIPEPIPTKTLQGIKSRKGLSYDEKAWFLLPLCSTLIALILTYYLKSPFPLLTAFSISAIASALLEDS